jgi:chromosome segregation ATPase
MIDLEKRLGAQEQMNKFLVSEINNQEQDLDVIKKRYSKLEELERSQRSKLESSLKYASEENKYSISDLLSRVDMLEENLQKEEKQRVSYIDKIRNTEQNQKELVHLIKNIERQENSELSQMRELIHSKLGSDELTQVQQHEKSMALFNEVVRLGQQYESTSAHLQDLTTSLGNKLHIFESRIQKGETTLGALESMSGNEGGAFQAFAEKCNMRLSIIENAVQTVGVCFFIPIFGFLF